MGRRSDSQTDIPNVTYLNENSDEEDEDNIYELSNNAYVTKQDLLTGLAQVGNSFGKDNRIIERRPSTMQIMTGKNKKYEQRQQRVNESRSKLREKDKRMVQMFPKYIEKSGNKKHA
jgi:hypothetical protein